MLRTRTSRLVLAAVAALFVPVAAHAPSQALEIVQGPAKLGFGGYAFGSKVSVGTVVKSGPTAQVTLGCTTKSGVSASNSTAALTLPSLGGALGKVGVTKSTVTTGSEGFLSVMTSDASAASVSLLSGLIQASAVQAQAVVKGKPFTTSGSSNLVGLVIAGRKIAAQPAPNTKISLGALGHVILNEQKSQVSTFGARQTTTALHVVLLPSSTRPNGLDIEISKAEATLTGEVAGAITGYAYGTKIDLLSGTVKSGPTAPIWLPCYGTNGATTSNSIATVSLPNVLTLGAVASTGKATNTLTDASATVNDTIGSVNLFGGAVKASAVKAELSATRVLGLPQSLQDTSQLVGLTVAGTAYGDSIPPNTQITVPGIGTLWVHRVVTLPNGVTEVRMLELVLSQETGGLPIGTSVKVGVAGLLIAD